MEVKESMIVMTTIVTFGIVATGLVLLKYLDYKYTHPVKRMKVVRRNKA